MVLQEVLDSPDLSEAEKLAYALSLGNGDISAGEMAEEILASMLDSEEADGIYLKTADLKFLADVVNS